MNFELNAEQVQLQSSVQRLYAERFQFDTRCRLLQGNSWHSESLWSDLTQLGLPAVLVPESVGGIGGHLEDMWPVLHAAAGALSLEPIISSMVLGTSALSLSGGSHVESRWLSELAEGRKTLAWAHDESASSVSAGLSPTRARLTEKGWVISGHKGPVLHGPLVHGFIVTARVQDPTSTAPHAEERLALFLVDRSQAQPSALTGREYRLVDDTAASNLHFEDTNAHPLGNPFDSAFQSQLLEQVTLLGMAALCVDMLGAMEAAYRMSIDYLNVRKQFGRLIGQNQALRHRAADMRVHVELGRSAAMAAVIAADRPLAPGSHREVLQAKLILGRYARQVCESAIHCHGGIGMTEEYAVGHYLRRVHVADHWFGHSQHLAHRLASSHLRGQVSLP